MSTPAPPQIECETIHPSLPVPDVRVAADFYTKKLGFTLAFTSGEPPTIAGVNLGRVQLFLERGTPNAGAAYFVVDDADALHEYHRAMGVEIVEPIGDRAYGLRDYSVVDPFGHRLGFGQHLFNAGPPIMIERVDVPIRIEKRLAAVLQDLAAHNRVSVSSALEEILCHTNDGVGPHTRRTIDHIQTLKAKHGIDYDSHGSYRFKER